MKRVTAVIMAGILAGISGATNAGDAAAGKARAATCAGCHGAQGVSNNPMWPNLAGQQQGYLVIFEHNKKKSWRKELIRHKGKEIFAVWV